MLNLHPDVRNSCPTKIKCQVNFRLCRTLVTTSKGFPRRTRTVTSAGQQIVGHPLRSKLRNTTRKSWKNAILWILALNFEIRKFQHTDVNWRKVFPPSEQVSPQLIPYSRRAPLRSPGQASGARTRANCPRWPVLLFEVYEGGVVRAGKFHDVPAWPQLKV